VDDAAATEGGLECGEGPGDFVDAPSDNGLGRDIDIVFGKVDAGFKKGDELDKGALGRSDAALSAPPICPAA